MKFVVAKSYGNRKKKNKDGQQLKELDKANRDLGLMVVIWFKG